MLFVKDYICSVKKCKKSFLTDLSFYSVILICFL